MTEQEMLELEKYWCENCCNFDKEHILMDGQAKCKITGTLAYCEESGKECKCFNVPADNIIVPPCKIGDKIYETDGIRIYESTIAEITYTKNKTIYDTNDIGFDDDAIGNSIFLTREEAERSAG